MKWKLEKRKVKDLYEYAKNARKLTKDQGEHLKKSLDKFGQCEPIVINTDDVIIGGHQRLKTMKKLGYKEVDVYVPEEPLNNKEVEELNIRLNKNVGEWDWDMLANAWDPSELVEWGFTEDELKADVDVIEGKEPEDDAPEPPKESKTKPGDLYVLGNQRLLCGDCTNPLHVGRLLGEQKVDMLCTDPPYGVDYVGKGKTNAVKIENDAKDNYRQFFGSFLSIIPWEEKNTSYIFMSGKELHNVRFAMEDCGMKWGDYLIWIKNKLVLGRKDYNAKHEFIVYGWKGSHKFYGPTNSVTTIEWDRPQSSKEHPTMKPIGLVAKLIKDGSDTGFKVYDPFSGSGTTLLACEANERRCYGMELSPNYCDVIVNRWVKYRREQNYPSIIYRNGEAIDWELSDG